MKKKMNFILVIVITLGNAGKGSESFELRIPQKSQRECEKAAKTFTFSLPAVTIVTHCEPSKENQSPEVRGVSF